MKEDMTIQIQLSIEEVNSVINALSEFPYKVSAELIEKIRGQAIPQVHAINNAKNAAGGSDE